MPLVDTLTTDMRTALKARDKATLGTTRLLISAFKNAAIAKGGQLDEAEEVSLLATEAKRRRESIDAYRDAGRDDLADQEAAELVVIETYLPKQLSEDEARELVAAVIAELGATSKRDMGKVMGKVMPQLRGRFPGKAVKPIVDALLS